MSCTKLLRTGLFEAIIVQTEEAGQHLNHSFKYGGSTIASKVRERERIKKTTTLRRMLEMLLKTKKEEII